MKLVIGLDCTIHSKVAAVEVVTTFQILLQFPLPTFYLILCLSWQDLVLGIFTFRFKVVAEEDLATVNLVVVVDIRKELLMYNKQAQYQYKE
jgi:hypothetical protein